MVQHLFLPLSTVVASDLLGDLQVHVKHFRDCRVYLIIKVKYESVSINVIQHLRVNTIFLIAFLAVL
jgi:hypothetical protein